MARPVKNEQIANLQEVIKDAAWAQIASRGAAALSLRAIGRVIGISAPAIYHYYPNRDALVTALIIDAYLSLGDEQLLALEGEAEGDPREKLRAIGMAYRDWALNYPQRYQLIFGTPLAGYEAPDEEVLPAATMSLWALLSVLDSLHHAGSLRLGGFPDPAPEAMQHFNRWKKFAGEYDIRSLAVTVLVLSRVHGLVSLELAGNIPPHGVEPGALYRWDLDCMLRDLIVDN